MSKKKSIEAQTIVRERSKLSPEKRIIRSIHKASSLDHHLFTKTLQKEPSVINNISKLSPDKSNPTQRFKHSSLDNHSISKILEKLNTKTDPPRPRLKSEILPHTSSPIVVKVSKATKLSSPQPPQEENFDDLADILPNWLITREDFKVKYNQMIKLEFFDISEVVLRPLLQRTHDERNALYNWVSSTEFFKTIPSTIVRELCDCLQCIKYSQNDKSK